MSLKARLRVAVAVLMSAMVLVLSVLYISGYLKSSFTHTHKVATSIADQLAASIGDDLRNAAMRAEPVPAGTEEVRKFWLNTVDTSTVVRASVERTIAHWDLLWEVFITDPSGTIRMSSVPSRAGSMQSAAPDLSEWTRRSVVENFREVYIDHDNMEVLRSLRIPGDPSPLLTIHVVVSSLFLRNELQSGLKTLAFIALACLVVSVILAIILPTFLLSPLERLSQSLDLMTTGDLVAKPVQTPESREFAAVYSKLNVLGQKVEGVREHANQLRGNVEQLLDRLEQAVVMVDASGQLAMAGNSAGRLLGYEPSELIGKDVDEVFPPTTEIGAMILAAVHRGQIVRDRPAILKGRGQNTQVSVSVQPLLRGDPGRPMGAVITMRDVGSRGEVAARLGIAARLAALGQLTHGVAHEIKNPLNSIRLHVEVLRTRLEEPAPEVDVIANEISRLDRVVKTFLDFNRPVEPHLGSLDANEVIAGIAKLVSLDANAHAVEIHLRPASRAAVFQGDVDLLKQAVLNVVMNAVEAMPQGGALSLETWVGGGQVDIVVSDTGPGISPEMRSKIFDLYFSTKPNGSGIGLAMAYRLVQLQDGKIEVSSEPGSGSTFRFSFPEATSNPSHADNEFSRGQRA